MSDRRREPRFSTNRPAELVLLSENDERLPIQMVEVSGSGVRFIVQRPVTADTAVRIDMEDSILLGEVCYCTPEGEDHICGVRLEQGLTHVTDLYHLVCSVMGEAAPHSARK